jgi:4-hydroxy 2-oxovalerate aldolase
MSRPPILHDIQLTDTTLRDGSHAMAHQFTVGQVLLTYR